MGASSDRPAAHPARRRSESRGSLPTPAVALAALALALPGPAAPGPAAASGPAGSTEAPSARGDSDAAHASGAGLRELLIEAAADPGRYADTLFMSTECRRDSGMEAVEIWGHGVGVWDRRLQFRLPPAGIARLLAAFVDSDFAAMPETFGGGPPDPRRPPSGGPAAARELICTVRIELAGLSEEVFQLRKGEQSPELARLSEAFFAICAEPAKEGIGAASVADGLEKIADGRLAPEVLFVLLQRRPAAGAQPGFLLRLEGRLATSRELPAAAPRGPLWRLELADDALPAIAGAAAAERPDELPVNLFAPHTTDLTIELLDHRVSVQARDFAGMTAASRGEAQARFDALFELLAALHRRVLAEGETGVDTALRD